MIKDLDPEEQAILNGLSYELGKLAGSLSRPNIRAGLIELLSETPDGDFTFAVLMKTHERMSDILKVAELRRM
jgi:hypothetical protein